MAPSGRASVATHASSTDTSSWNEALLRHGGSFLQSYEWGEFQTAIGREIVRLQSSAFQATLIRHPLPLGRSYLYCPRGPVALQPADDAAALAQFVEQARALERGAIFLKIEPEWPDEGAVGELGAQGFTKTDAEQQPAKTLLLDIEQPEEQLFAAMKKGRRYDIRLAERKGVAARKLGQEGEAAFLKLLTETAERDGFRTHPLSYYRAMLELFKDGDDEKPYVELWGAEYQGRLLAINLVLCWGGRMTYLHAASSSQHRDVMAPAFLQWHVIKEAKRRGYKQYDLWGISESWPGVSRFKRAFGGREVEYVGSYELALRPFSYRTYALLRSLRRRA